MTAVGCTGHRAVPYGIFPYIHSRLCEVLEGMARDLVGISSLAAGADQMFARSVLDRGGRLHAVVPSRSYAASLEGDELDGYCHLLACAQHVETLEYEHPTDEAYLAAGRRVVDLAELVIAVWDGQPARGVGGTADVVGYAREVGKPLIVLWPPGTRRDG